MTFAFSDRSRRNLEGVKTDLVRLCERALELSPIDFGITQGMRSEEEQAILVSIGRSQTMNSRHLTGDAIDFAPYVSGSYRDEWPFYYPIVDVFIQVAREARMTFIWGGAWGVLLGNVAVPNKAAETQAIYISRKLAEAEKMGVQPSFFFDGPHIETIDTDMRAA